MAKDTSKPKKEPWNLKHKQPLRSDQVGSPEIGQVQEKLIGRVIVEWSKLEQCIQDLIWRLVNLRFEDGRVITERMDVTRLIAIAKVLSRRHLKDEALLTEVLDALARADELRDDRNFVVHGTWCTVEPDGIAYSSSLRQKSLPGEVTAEEFPHSRMRRIVAEIIRVKRVVIKAYEVLPYPYDDTRPLKDRVDPGGPPKHPTTQTPK
jgi:hypothetical protein